MKATQLLVYMAALALFACSTGNTEAASSSGKSKRRAPPPEVSPVAIDGVRYEAFHWGKSRDLGQNGGHVVAIDEATGSELWLLKVYEVDYDGDMEPDKQDRFITRLRRAGRDGLRVYDEDCGEYLIDLQSREVSVEKSPPCRR